MKKLLLLLLIAPVLGFSQTSSFERGFRDGYCQAKKEDKGQYTTCATSPLAPRPKVGRASYQDGFAEGFKTYNGKGNSSKMLIDGQRKIAASNSINSTDSLVEGFNSGLKNYRKSQPSKSTETNNNTNYRSNLNQQIRTNNLIIKNVAKYVKQLSKYASPSKTECPDTYDLNCKWIVKDGLNQRDLRKYWQAKSNWEGSAAMYENIK